VRRVLRELALLPLHLYRRVISPAFGPHCRYHPTCSEYAVEAVRTHGVARGSVLAAWRVLRCNPWSRGGVDPVASQTLFRPRPAGPRPARPRTAR
jgi:putative membrane protein insertion efficiency factor